MNDIKVCGINHDTFMAQLEKLLTTARPAVLGVATAFLSVAGAHTLARLVAKSGTTRVRVVAGLSGCITHPQAIRDLMAAGYSVRLGVHSSGIFHPKLFVGGEAFRRSGELINAGCGYIGSANLTNAGLLKNLEVGLGTKDPSIAMGLGSAFAAIWATSGVVKSNSIEKYEVAFAESQRRRSIEDLRFLNVVDGDARTKGVSLVETRHAVAVWAGLESFTGEHTFQVEFPKKAGEVLRNLFGRIEGEVPIECSDGQTRSMVFRYYEDNGMYRLNVPNDMPLVDWARQEKRGALVVWQESAEAHGNFHAQVLRGSRLREIVSRSKELGAFGKTATREYGWY